MLPALTLLPLVGDLAKGILDRVWPKEATEEERATAEAQIQAVIFEQTKSLIQLEVEDLANARAAEGTALIKAPSWINGVRAIW